MAITNESLYQLIKDGQYIDLKILDSVFEAANQENRNLEDLILSKDLISDLHLGQLIADHLKLPFVNLEKEPIDRQLLLALPKTVAKSHLTVCFTSKDGIAQIATTNPDQTTFLSLLKKKLNCDITVQYTTKKSIEHALDLYKEGIENEFNQLVNSVLSGEIDEIPIAHLVDLLIDYANSSKASDIHIEPTDEESSIRFRVDGNLRDVLDIPKNLHDQIISRIKVMSNLRTDEHLSAQDGKIRTFVDEEEIDVRVSIVPITSGEKAVLRLLSSKSREYGLSDLGMNESDHQKVIEAMNKPYGMILSTGPTGSGKTTTMYSILKILNTEERNIATIEDPVEYQIEGINQIQVNAKTNLTFANGLRAILRQDPNVIYVGEIRDNETSDIAINSALTGHLVLSTLHTNDAATAIPRLFDLGGEPFLIASTVNVIIAQRLVRKICDKCKVSQTADYAHLKDRIPEKIFKKYFGKKTAPNIYMGKGCTVCNNTGYKGRVGLFEVLIMSESIRELIDRNADSDEIKKAAINEGMTTMFDDGIEKVLSGITTIDEIIKAVTD